MTEVTCDYSDEKPCEFRERNGREPGPYDCQCCALFNISEVLISIWAMLDEKKEGKV